MLCLFGEQSPMVRRYRRHIFLSQKVVCLMEPHVFICLEKTQKQSMLYFWRHVLSCSCPSHGWQSHLFHACLSEHVIMCKEKRIARAKIVRAIFMIETMNYYIQKNNAQHKNHIHIDDEDMRLNWLVFKGYDKEEKERWAASLYAYQKQKQESNIRPTKRRNVVIFMQEKAKMLIMMFYVPQKAKHHACARKKAWKAQRHAACLPKCLL